METRELLTVVITTSPVVSHPSLALLETVLRSFVHVPDLWDCPKVVVCDGIRLLPNSVRTTECSQGVESHECHAESRDKEKKPSLATQRRKYGTIAKAMRSGYVDPVHAEKYNEFKLRLQSRCDLDAEKRWHPVNAPFAGIRLKYLEDRSGYGFTLREALLPENGLVSTKYVCVVQHDRTFLREVPVRAIIASMDASGSVSQTKHDDFRDQLVKSVGLLTRSNLNYLQRLKGRPAVRGHHFDIESLVREPPELQVAGRHTRSKLIPLLQFYDSTHIALAKHYLEFVFDAGRRLVSRGGFVEDRLSIALSQSIRRYGLVGGHRPFGCYLFDDGLSWSGLELNQLDQEDNAVSVAQATGNELQKGAHRLGVGHVGHLDGGSFISSDALRKKIIADSRQRTKDSSTDLPDVGD